MEITQMAMVLILGFSGKPDADSNPFPSVLRFFIFLPSVICLYPLSINQSSQTQHAPGFVHSFPSHCTRRNSAGSCLHS